MDKALWQVSYLRHSFVPRCQFSCQPHQSSSDLTFISFQDDLTSRLAFGAIQVQAIRIHNLTRLKILWLSTESPCKDRQCKEIAWKWFWTIGENQTWAENISERNQTVWDWIKGKDCRGQPCNLVSMILFNVQPYGAHFAIMSSQSRTSCYAKHINLAGRR